jgi:spore coat protein SA
MTSNSLSRKSLAIVVPELLPVPPVKGGAVEHWVHEASKRLDQAKFDISIISRPANDHGIDGVQYLTIPWTKTEQFFHRIKERLTWRNPLRYLAKMQNVASYGIRMAKLVHSFDLVVIHNEPNLLLFLKNNPLQKVILHMHNEHLTIRMFRPFYCYALKKVDSVICVSDYIRRSAIKHFPQYADKFIVVFNATDPNVFMPYADEALHQLKEVVALEADKKYLLYVGRLTEFKGVHVLIQAFEQIHQRLPNTKLIIVGSSFFEGAAKTAYEQALVELAKPIGQHIIFTGYIPHEKLKYLYSAVDVVVLPSIWQDPCPLVVLEAMASGTCLVSSAVGGVPEVVENKINGILVKESDVDALVSAVCNVLLHDEHKVQMEYLARQKILAGYAWERLVGELEAILFCCDDISQIDNATTIPSIKYMNNSKLNTP